MTNLIFRDSIKNMIELLIIGESSSERTSIIPERLSKGIKRKIPTPSNKTN